MSRSRRRRGMALILVLVFSTMILAAWGLVAHRTIALVQLLEYVDARESQNLDVLERRAALAYGLALLETGDPPVEPGESEYACVVPILRDDGSMRFHHLRFALVDLESWSVDARLLQPEDPADLPSPTSFPPPEPEEPEQP